MIDYNHNAWEELRKLTGKTMQGLLDEINSLGIALCTNTFTNWRRDGNIPPDALVRICNHFRYPISYFFRIVGHETDPRDYHLVDEDKWIDIELKTCNFKEIYPKKTMRKEIIRKLGCSMEYYTALRKYPAKPLPARLSLRIMIGYFNHARIYAGDIFIDHNVLIPMEYNIVPYLDQVAKDYYFTHFANPKITLVAEDVIDTVEFLKKYVSRVNLEGDDLVIGIKNKALNEIASIITNMRDELLAENQHRQQLQAELDELKATLKPLNP